MVLERVERMKEPAEDYYGLEPDGGWIDIEAAWVYDTVLGKENRPESLKNAGKDSQLPTGEELDSEEAAIKAAADRVLETEREIEAADEAVAAAEAEAAEAEAEAAGADQVKEAIDLAAGKPAEKVEPAEEKWTTVSGKVTESERDAFKKACKAEDAVPSKMIRAFITSFCEPEGETEQSEPVQLPICKECGGEILTDYYRFADEYTCGDCVVKLIKKKEKEAYNQGLEAMPVHPEGIGAQPTAGSPESSAAEEQPAQLAPPLAELQKVQCKQCLGEAHVPKDAVTWTCVVCNFLNSGGGS